MASWAELRKPELRDPRAFIIPSDQRDFPTAVKFINALREVNVTVHRATAAFQANGKRYPAGSFVVMTSQAFRPHVMDMFEPQDHPNVIAYPGAPPTRPYDNAGWTLAFQMGVQFDRMLEPVTGPFEKVTDWNVKPPAGTVPATGELFTFDRGVNDAFTAVNRLLKAGKAVGANNREFVVTADPATLRALAPLGISFKPAIDTISVPLHAPRIGLWDQYGGSIESGWTRWILEQFEFPFSRVYAPELDAGNLNAKYDVLIFVSGAIPAAGGGGRGPSTGAGPAARGGGAGGPDPQAIPAEYRSQLGRVTADKTIPQIRAFIENGGTVVALSDSAMNLAAQLKLPIENHLVENGAPIPSSKYFVPGSVLTVKVDTTPSARRRHVRAHRLLLRQQPGVQARSRGGGRQRPRVRAIRFRHAAAQRLGVGPEVPRRRRRRDRGAGRQGARGPLRPGDPAAGPAARHVQAALQRAVGFSHQLPLASCRLPASIR